MLNIKLYNELENFLKKLNNKFSKSALRAVGKCLSHFACETRLYSHFRAGFSHLPVDYNRDGNFT